MADVAGVSAPRSLIDRYKKLEQTVELWLLQQNDTNRRAVEEACNMINQIIPDWCWLALIREEVAQTAEQGLERHQQSVARVGALANRTKRGGDEVDQHSLTSYVWASYLRDDRKASHLVGQTEIESIKEFDKRIQSDERQRSTAQIPAQDFEFGDVMSALTLHCV